MERQHAIAAGAACLLLAGLCWYFWPQPNPLDSLPVEEQLLTIESLSIDGKAVADWPAEMEAGQSCAVELTGRVAPEPGMPTDAKAFQPSEMRLVWIARYDRDRYLIGGTLTNEQDRTHSDPKIETDADGHMTMSVMALPPSRKRKPSVANSPESNRTFAGELQVPQEPGEYHLQMLVTPAASSQLGSSFSPLLTRHWRVTVHDGSVSSGPPSR